MQPITSIFNSNIKHAAALLAQHRYRKKNAQTVIEGVHLLEAYCKHNLPIKQVILSQTAYTHPEVINLLTDTECTSINPKNIVITTDALYKKIRTLGDGVDIMALIDTPMPTLGNISTDCLILDGLQDTGNIGTLLRTAAAVGISTIITTPNTAHLWSPKCLRAGMGAHFSIKIYEQICANTLLQKIKLPLYATSSHTDKVIYQHNLTHPMAWVFGHEGQGVSDVLLKNATAIALPQPGGQESLNVGVAGSVCLYEMLRQRHYQS